MPATTPFNWTQDIDEPCESDGDRTISPEDRFHLGKAIGGYANLRAVAYDKDAAKPPSDQIADIVSHHGASPRRKHQKRERQFSASRENRCKNEERLARQRKAQETRTSI